MVPQSISWPPGEEAATRSEPVPERCAAPRVPSEEAAATGAGWAQGAGVAREVPGLLRQRTTPAAPQAAFPLPVPRPPQCLCRERAVGQAAAGEMAERELGWEAPGGGRPLGPASCVSSVPTGARLMPRLLSAL